MARNLEIKVACSPEALLTIQRTAEGAAGGPVEQMLQTDTYFHVTTGRLKLREIDTNGTRTAELIAYRRPDACGSRWSDYCRVPIGDAAAAECLAGLSFTCGVRAVVRKRRNVVVIERTRVHLDLVDGLGAFVELETVAREGDTDDAIAGEHRTIIELLGLDALEVIAGSYEDLIAERADVPRATT